MAASIPFWINEDHIVDVLEETVEGFKSINKFTASLAGGVGENYQSVIIRVEIKAELNDGTFKDLSFMIKTVPQTEQAAMMMAMIGHFPRENLIYSKYLPAFEKIYANHGSDIIFGPKRYIFKKNPETEYVCLDDLCLQGFKNENRVQGLDRDHTEAVLKKLAKFHAASAVQYEFSGTLETPLVTSMFNEQTIAMFSAIMQPSFKVFLDCLAKSGFESKYIEKARVLLDGMMDMYLELYKPNYDDFNVICHGDLWSNNIMFLHDEQIDGRGTIKDTRFIDFQMSRYCSPVFDLYYFLLTSPKLEVKVANFDDFVKFYHDHLVENLKLLQYPKKLPTLKDLQMDLLKKSTYGFSTLTNTCAGILLDPSEMGNMEDFFKGGDAAERIKIQLYTNPRYVEHLEVLLPWMDSRGFLD